MPDTLRITSTKSVKENVPQTEPTTKPKMGALEIAAPPQDKLVEKLVASLTAAGILQ